MIRSAGCVGEENPGRLRIGNKRGEEAEGEDKEEAR